MRRALVAVVAAVAVGVAVTACSSSTSTQHISRSTATKAAIKSVEQLERESAQPRVYGFEVTQANLATSVAGASDGHGHVLTVTPSVSTAWIVQLLAPAQLPWSATPAIAIVDASSGVVRASALWKRPQDAPIKP